MKNFNQNAVGPNLQFGKGGGQLIFDNQTFKFRNSVSGRSTNVSVDNVNIANTCTVRQLIIEERNADNPSIISLGNNVISNIAPGISSGDAVNLQQVQQLILANVNSGGYDVSILEQKLLDNSLATTTAIINMQALMIATITDSEIRHQTELSLIIEKNTREIAALSSALLSVIQTLAITPIG